MGWKVRVPAAHGESFAILPCQIGPLPGPQIASMNSTLANVCFAATAIAACISTTSAQSTLNLVASKDATLNESASGTVANGAGAFVVTVSLGLLMAKLVDIKFVDLPEKPEKLSMMINPQITPPPIINTKKPEKYKWVEPPPAPPIGSTTPSGPVAVPPSDFGEKIPDYPNPRDFMEPITVSVDLGLIPIVRARPVMPARAERSGHCNVTFDVNANGSTYNVHVLNCSQSLFARASIKAAGKWKYRPQTIAGKAVPRTGLRTMITFKLTDEHGRLIPQ